MWLLCDPDFAMTYEESRRMPQYFTLPTPRDVILTLPFSFGLWRLPCRPPSSLQCPHTIFRTAKHGLCEMQIRSSTAQNPSTIRHKTLHHNLATFPWPPPKLVPQSCYWPFHNPNSPLHASTPLGMLELSLKRLSSALVHTTRSHLLHPPPPSPDNRYGGFCLSAFKFSMSFLILHVIAQHLPDSY